VIGKSYIKSHTQISHLSKKAFNSFSKISNLESLFFLKSQIFQVKSQISSLIFHEMNVLIHFE